MVHPFTIPSPVQNVSHPVFKKLGITCLMKRDDLIHPVISGNKWRKLKFNIKHVKKAGLSGFVTFGGAYSNHLAASAFAAHLSSLKMVAIVRGEEPMQNSTLDFIALCGAQIVQISRAEYAQKSDAVFLEKLKARYPDMLIIPEGGANVHGVLGCAEILSEIKEPVDIIACPLGTATTFTGLLASAKSKHKLWGFPAVKGGAYLREDVKNLLKQVRDCHSTEDSFTNPEWQLQIDYHFGGFGKVAPGLIRFMNDFWRETQIPLDPIYTGKMMCGILEMAEEGRIPKGSRLLVLHTGGLQGIKGMNERLRKKDLRIDYEETVAAAHHFPNL